MLLVDWQIEDLCVNKDGRKLENPLIDPFSPGVSGGGLVSWGLTHVGYDIRMGNHIYIFKNSYNEVIDPRRFKDPKFLDKVFDRITIDNGGHFVMPPHSYALGTSYEYIRMPRNLKARVVGKSTMARSGIMTNTTPLEPEWHGYVTLELANLLPCPVCLYVMQGIAQIEFEKLAADPEESYQDKAGVYQGQQGVTPSRVK